MNQVKAYKPDPKISLVLRGGGGNSTQETLNQAEKERYNKMIRETALGLYKNYKKSSVK
jgi:putative salt-induced outer membrane protein YdiY